MKFNTTDGLAKLVGDHIADGWLPFGGTSTFDGGDSICQPMVKESTVSTVIVCAANKYEFPDDVFTTPLVICGARHWDRVMHAQISAIDSAAWSHRISEVQGFIDNHGNFLTREEAHIIAKAAGQIKHRCGGDEKRLFSENLY